MRGDGNVVRIVDWLGGVAQVVPRVKAGGVKVVVVGVDDGRELVVVEAGIG